MKFNPRFFGSNIGDYAALGFWEFGEHPLWEIPINHPGFSWDDFSQRFFFDVGFSVLFRLTSNSAPKGLKKTQNFTHVIPKMNLNVDFQGTNFTCGN